MGGRGLPLRHARAAPVHRGLDRAGPPRREAGGARRPLGVGLPRALPGRRPDPGRRDGRLHRRHHPMARRAPGAPGGPAPLRHHDAATTHRLPAPGLPSDPAAPVLHLERPVLERLPVHVRVLRHPRALRPQSAAQDARAGAGRARRPRRGRGPRHLLRGRQLHREPESGPGAAPPPGGMAAAPSLPGALRLRGHAQHRQERARPRPHARRRLPRGVLRHRDPGAGRAPVDVQGAATTASRWSPASSSGSTPTPPRPPIT